MSKGSIRRPAVIDKSKFDENWVRTFGREPKEQEHDPRYDDWRGAYEADKRRGKGNVGK